MPMPNNGEMVFVPVCVNKDSGSLGWKKIELGDSSGDFKEQQVSTALGGSFPLMQNGVKYWCFYMGKYEVTTREYNSIVNPHLLGKDRSKDLYPITNISWNDALNFSDKYNQWLFANAKDKIPKYDKSYGFLRLPTEEEWEFAARGASSVTADKFRAKIPYPYDKLHEYEWFGGPESSHYKLQKVGKLKPNPIGLHDMLGNVSEMTMSLFKVGYNEGPTGGFVVKGNNYTTAKNRLRSSYRSEQPFYRQHSSGMLMPHTQKTLGFRLVISAILFPSRKAQKKISSSWSKYSSDNSSITSSKAIGDTGSVKKGITHTDTVDSRKRHKESIEISDDLFFYLTRLTKDVDRAYRYDKAYRSISDIIYPNRNQSYIWIKIASKLIVSMERLKKKYISTKLLEDITYNSYRMRTAKRNRETLATIKRDMDSALASYLFTIRELSKNSIISIKKGLVIYRFFLKRHRNSRELPILDIIKEDIFQFKKDKNIDIIKSKRAF
ncbi:hypothetical protein MNB_SV-6-1260 [hydrothermal vent metagenome]|uniref:Sulfatase-modifying factor enzyme-like domain-containing protein n=1 Tax=hydrothermal vent metagenome TaxID=652676 RepID=A0A1W1BDJ2_9ZZZZ